jgi:hypothetical protein
MTDMLTPDRFQTHTNKLFRIRDGHQALRLVRIERREREDWELDLSFREPFNLIFQGPAGDPVAEGLHTLEAEDGSTFQLYVIPIHTHGLDRQEYQVPFN